VSDKIYAVNKEGMRAPFLVADQHAKITPNGTIRADQVGKTCAGLPFLLQLKSLRWLVFKKVSQYNLCLISGEVAFVGIKTNFHPIVQVFRNFLDGATLYGECKVIFLLLSKGKHR